MSFWTANDKIPVQQTKVNIPAEHGLDYTSGQKIDLINAKKQLNTVDLMQL